MAGVFGVLSHLHLLDQLTEGGTISGTILPSDTDLLSTLSLWEKKSFMVKGEFDVHN